MKRFFTESEIHAYYDVELKALTNEGISSLYEYHYIAQPEDKLFDFIVMDACFTCETDQWKVSAADKQDGVHILVADETVIGGYSLMENEDFVEKYTVAKPFNQSPKSKNSKLVL